MTADEVGHHIRFRFRRSANKQADFGRLGRSRVARRRLRDHLIFGNVGQMHGGDSSDFEATFVEIEISGATALSNHVDDGGSLRAQTLS